MTTISVAFALVDVFTTVPLTGNPLAVVPFVPGLTGDDFRGLAREFNQIETTILLPATQPDADWRLRSFTAIGVEVFGAGHNALGAWWWLASSGVLQLHEGSVAFRQQLGDRVLPLAVHVAQGRPVSVGMTQSAARFGAIARDRGALASALGVAATDLVDTLPTQVVATDVAHLLVPVRREALPRIRPDAQRLADLVSTLGGEGCYVFTMEPHEKAATADARFFNPGVGIAEDPATGTAAGPLAAYLVHNGIATGPRIVIDQGRETGRPSRLEVYVNGSQIELRGAAVVTAQGTIRVR